MTAMTPGDSYWVKPDQLLAGPYPGAAQRSEAQAKLEAFLDIGVTCFVDLTEEGEGPPLHPYAALLRRAAARRQTQATHVRLPIPDLGTPSYWQMRAILGVVRAAMAAGEVVYVHCWGGVGRTGTVIGCLLVEDGSSPTEVLSELAEMRRHTDRAYRAAPETQAQRTFVQQWSKTESS